MPTRPTVIQMKIKANYRPNQFRSTKANSIPIEPKVVDIVRDFGLSYTEPRQARHSSPDLWRLYPSAVIKRALLLDRFPEDVPVGWVLASFFLSVRPESYRPDQVVSDLFDWLSVDGVAADIASAGKQGTFLVSEAPAPGRAEGAIQDYDQTSLF